jgi:subtilisin family serine protease
MSPRIRLVVLSLSCAIAASFGAPAASATSPHDLSASALGKIDPWVLERAAEPEIECIVVLADRADLTPAAGIPSKLEKGRFVHDALIATARASQAPLLAWLEASDIGHQAFYIVNAVLVRGDFTTIGAIAERPEVARVEGNPAITNLEPVSLTPEEIESLSRDALAPQAIEPGVTSIHAPEVWSGGHTGQGIVIGGADTGVKWDHPALINKYRGWNGTTASHDYNWHDAIHSGGGSCGPNSIAPCDDHGHGTHTVGTAVGSDAAGTNQIGVAPGARFIACRNMDQGVGTPARYLECMQWFLAPYPIGGTPAQGDPSRAPDVTTNSWGCPASEGCATSTLQAAVEAQRAAGILFVASAGNSGSSCSTISDPPSFHDASYTVGAYSATTGTIASFSSRGPVTADGSNRMKPDLTAPGVSVRSANRSNGYSTSSGTSMSAPHVAGAVALLWSAHPFLRHQIQATEDLLNQSAVDVSVSSCGSSGVPNHAYGWGRLDIQAAVSQAVPVSVADPATSGPGVWLAHPYPNPAHHSALLRFRLEREGRVDFAIYSSAGQRVRTLVRESQAAGEHSVRWDGLSDRGIALPAGVYWAGLETTAGAASQKLIWLSR